MCGCVVVDKSMHRRVISPRGKALRTTALREIAWRDGGMIGVPTMLIKRLPLISGQIADMSLKPRHHNFSFQLSPVASQPVADA